jgi:hypothetical protein
LLYSTVLTKPGIASVVDFDIGYIAQNISDSAQCHFDDGWGPSSSDPAGIEGLQDCSLDRYNLCAFNASKAANLPSIGWDFLACTYRNQKETDTITDGGKRFADTVHYCAGVSGIISAKLDACARGAEGQALAQASHALEESSNPNRDNKGHGHPTWIAINGVVNTDAATWLKAICAAVPSSVAKPAACH